MKNLLLTILLLPTLLFGQDMYLTKTITENAPYSVGDTITVVFSPNLLQATPTLIQFDYQYNNKLLQKVSHEFLVNQNGVNTSAQTALNSWTGYTFNPNSGVAQNLLSQQYAQGLSYSVAADWSVERVTIQDGITIGSANEPLIQVKFLVKDKQNTNFTNYSEVTKLNWSRAINNSNYTSYDIHGQTMALDLGQVGGTNAGNVTINLNTPASAANAEDFTYQIYLSSDVTSGVINQNASVVSSGNFDANGQAIIQGLINDVEYFMTVGVSGQHSWLDDVVTVTDAYLLFQHALSSETIPGGNSSNAVFSYKIQEILGELTNDQLVDFDDSFISLAHINGVSHNGFITNSTIPYNISGIKSGFGDWSQSNPFVKTFTPTDSNKIFEVSHALRGDVDFSHSYTPTVAGYPTNSAKGIRVSKSVNAMKTPETANLDIVSSLVGGKVIVEISTTKQGMVGTQFNIMFDENILTLDTITYDTGNEMTNFGNIKGNKVSFGSLDYNGDKTVKVGTPYKLIFTPKQSITNTAGLINFKITEGVKQDGTKIKFNIQ